MDEHNAKPRVLVVDDEHDINRLLQVRLKATGFVVTSAPDGETAVQALQQEVPDLVMLDISMPGMSGLEVLDWIRAEGLDLAVVMTTAFGTEQVAIDALRRGADDYLRKPFEPGEFRAVVERTMEKLRLTRQNERLRSRLKHELIRAAAVQARLLPSSPPRIAGYDIAMRCQAAHEVGGDFFDWRVRSNGDLAVTLGDVMGKGMPAALLMATVRAALRPAMSLHDPGEATRIVQDALDEDFQKTESFVTLFLARLDGNHRVRYVDAGHRLALFVRANGEIEPLAAGGLPLGVLPASDHREHDLELAPGDVVVVYSDGLQDSISPDIDLPAALASVVRGSTSAAEAADQLIHLAGEQGEQVDDVTVIVIRRYDEGEPE